NAGLLVDPLDPRAIAQAMEWMLEHPEEAEAMGRRGRRAVEQRFNWQAEEEKLVKLYQRLLSEGTFRGAAGAQHEPYAGRIRCGPTDNRYRRPWRSPPESLPLPTLRVPRHLGRHARLGNGSTSGRSGP